MTKFELKQIIKGLIMESINESTSKNFVSSKKTKKLKEQDEMQPSDPQASAEPDAGEVEGPVEPQDLDADPIMAQIDSIIGSLNSLKSKLSGETEEPEGEEVSDVKESDMKRSPRRSNSDDIDQNDDNDDDDDDDDDLGSAKRLGYVDDDEEEGEGSEVDGRKNPMPRTTPSGHDVSRGISTGSGKPFLYYRKKSNL
jgi:hypothetical protein